MLQDSPKNVFRPSGNINLKTGVRNKAYTHAHTHELQQNLPEDSFICKGSFMPFS
jgi:hypothetical protein